MKRAADLSRRFCAALAVLSVALMLTGCWDVRSIDERAFVTVLALDAAGQDSDDLRLTGVVPIPRSIAGSRRGGGGQERDEFLIQVRSETLGEGMMQIASEVSRGLDWGQLDSIFISEAVARRPQALIDIVDPPIRETRVRNDARVYLAAAVPAGELVAVSPDIEQFISTYFDLAVQKEEEIETFSPVQVWELYSWVFNPGVDPYLPVVAVDQEEKQLSFQGIALFRDNRLVDLLGHEQAKFFGWFRGESNGGSLVIRAPEEQPDSKTTIRILKSTASYRPEMVDGELRMRTSLHLFAEIQSSENLRYVPEREEALQRAKERAAAKIRLGVRDVVERAQRARADVFGWGQLVRARQPQRWDSGKWPETFAGLPVEIDVRLQLRVRGAIW